MFRGLEFRVSGFRGLGFSACPCKDGRRPAFLRDPR